MYWSPSWRTSKRRRFPAVNRHPLGKFVREKCCKSPRISRWSNGYAPPSAHRVVRHHATPHALLFSLLSQAKHAHLRGVVHAVVMMGFMQLNMMAAKEPALAAAIKAAQDAAMNGIIPTEAELAAHVAALKGA